MHLVDEIRVIGRFGKFRGELCPGYENELPKGVMKVGKAVPHKSNNDLRHERAVS